MTLPFLSFTEKNKKKKKKKKKTKGNIKQIIKIKIKTFNY